MSTPASHTPPDAAAPDRASKSPSAGVAGRETVSRLYRAWGLRPIRIAAFAAVSPSDQIEDVERRLMVAGADA